MLKQLKLKVKHLLETNAGLRDDDGRLMSTIWYQQLGGKENIYKFTAYDLLEKIALKKISSAESIIRIRRKIQEQNIELRGKGYKQRKIKQVEVRQNIHSL